MLNKSQTMQSKVQTVAAYLTEIPEDQKASFNKLREVIINNIPKGFQECMNYGMIGFVVPRETYPNGYHCNPKMPLPFLNIASQKKIIAFYHMGIYANPDLLNWFVSEFQKHSKLKLDMGKSCIRFKNPNAIPFELMGELCRKISVQDWITRYEEQLKK